MKVLLLSLITLAFPPLVLGAVNCDEVLSDLQAMRRAQRSILVSLANNHESFASSLEEVTADLELYSKKVPAKALKSMNKTASAFRARGIKAKRQADNLDEATADLIDNVERCLKK